MKELINLIKNDKEIQMLKKQYYEIFDADRPYSIWEDESIEDYKEKLRKSIKEKKPY